MENKLKDERGWYLPEINAADLAETKRRGVWAAVERYGIPHATAAMWAGQERRRTREAERHYGSPETTRKQTESTIQVHRNREEGIKKTWRIHSNDEREAAVSEILQLGVAEVAGKYKVSEQTIRNWRAEMFSAADRGNDRSWRIPAAELSQNWDRGDRGAEKLHRRIRSRQDPSCRDKALRPDAIFSLQGIGVWLPRLDIE